MKNTSLNTKGFGFISVLVVLLAVAIISSLGWYVWQKSHENKTATVGNNTSSKSSHKAEAPGGAATHTAQEAVSLAQSAYDTALAYIQRTTNADQGEIDAIKPYLSTDLYNQLTATESQGPGRDIIMCDQITPDKITASLVSATPDVAVVNVAEVFGANTQNITVHVDRVNLKITALTC